MKLSNVVDTLRPAVRAMAGYLPGEQPQAGKFIKLNTNENPYPPSPAVTSAITQAANSGLQRYPDPLGTSFRIQAAEVLGVSPDCILCGNGSDDLLTILTRSFVAEGQTIWYPTPSYVLYRTLAEIQGAKVAELPFESDWTLRVDHLEQDAPPALMFLPNPNSPTGTVLSPEQIAAIAAELPCPLVVDEAYADFAPENCISLIEQCENVLVTRTLSKSYGLAGLRFGFLIARPEVINELRKVKDSYNCDALSISAATAAIGDQDWFIKNRDKVLETRQRLAKGLTNLGFQVQPSQANFVWCNHPSQSSFELYEQLKASQILVRYMKYEGWGEGLRISVGTENQIDALFAVLESLIR